MADIRETISLEDRFTQTLSNIIQRVEQFSNKMNMANYTTGEFVNKTNSQAVSLRRMAGAIEGVVVGNNVLTGSVKFGAEAADFFTGSINRMHNALARTQQPLRDMQHNMGKLDKHFTTAGFKGLVFGITVGNALTNLLYTIIRLPGEILKMGDTFILTQAKMTVATNSTSEALRANDLVYAAAQRSRSEYGEMASNVSKIGVAAKRYFGSSDEMVRFTETVAKSFTVAGATAEMRRNSTLQLIQALGSGKLQGDEFKSISEGAPLLLDALEKYTGIERGLLKEAGKEGKLTSDILKNAIINFSGEIDEAFNRMPTTFEQACTQMSNKLLYAFNPIMAEISASAGSVIKYLNDHLWEVFVTLTAIGVVLTVTLIPSMARLAAATWRWAMASWAAIGAFLMAHWVISLILVAVGLIALRIFQSKESMMEFGRVAGLVVATVYNGFLKFAEIVQNVLNGVKDIYNVFRAAEGRKLIEKTAWVTPASYMDPNALADKWKNAAGNLWDSGVKFKKTLQDTGSWLNIPGSKGMKGLDGSGLDGSGLPVNVKGGKLDSVKIYEEDLVLLKDLAMRDYQLNYSQVSPQMTLHFGDVHKEADVDGIVKRVNQEFIEAIKTNLRGGVIVD